MIILKKNKKYILLKGFIDLHILQAINMHHDNEWQKVQICELFFFLIIKQIIENNGNYI